MNTLREYLYQYISDERFSALESDGEYIQAEQMRNTAEKKLSAELTAEQRQLFSSYMDEENRLASIQLRHVFQETLAIVSNLLNLTL